MIPVLCSSLATDAFLAKERRLTTGAIEQLENIKQIVADRDDLRKKLTKSHTELEEAVKIVEWGPQFDYHWKSGVSFTSSQSEAISESISSLAPINENLTLNLTTVSKPCSKPLPNNDLFYDTRAKISRLDFKKLTERFEALKKITRERDELSSKVNRLERELNAYSDSPEDVHAFKVRSMMLDDVYQDRDRLRKQIDVVTMLATVLLGLRKRHYATNDLQDMIKFAIEDRKLAEQEVEDLKRKCTSAEEEVEDLQSRNDSLRSQLACMVHDIESLRYQCRAMERLKLERDCLQVSVNNLKLSQIEFGHVRSELKFLEDIKSERNMYKAKYDSLIGLECKCDILQAKLNWARDQLKLKHKKAFIRRKKYRCQK